MKAPCLIIAGLLWAGSALALDPSLDASQYGHTAWRTRDGFANGPVFSFAQTPDGYLWLGTEFGLVRFDGVRAVPWVPPRGARLPHDQVRALLAARDGVLWIGTQSGLASWDGRSLATHPAFDDKVINALVEDHDGTLWVSGQTSDGGLVCAIRGAAAQCDGADGSLGKAITSLYEDSKGVLWAAGSDRTWRWKPGPRNSLPGILDSLQGLSESATGTMVVARPAGLAEIAEDRVVPYPLPGTSIEFSPSALLRDREGALWIGTRDRGLLHVHRGRTDAFTRADGLSGDHVARLFEDREGNIWVATLDGLDRFRALTAATHAKPQGVLPGAGSVLATRDGILVATQYGLQLGREGRMAHLDVRGLAKPGVASLFEDRRGRIWLGSQSGVGYIEHGTYTALAGVPGGLIDSFAEDRDGNLWIAHRERGLLRIAPDGQIAWNDMGQRTRRRLAADPVRGGIWIGAFLGGLTHFVDGRIAASYSVRDGLGKGPIKQLSVAGDGTVWAATEGGLSRIKDGRIATLDKQGGLPCDNVNWMIEDAEHAWWLYTACGLARIARGELDDWSAAVDTGKAPRRIVTTVLDRSDGVPSVAFLGSYEPQAARSDDGKLWFVSNDGLMVVDPRHLGLNQQPPPVHVETIVADRKAYEAASGVRLPPQVRDLAIEYTATSLVAPEKMQFKYKLDGRDTDWNDAGNRRQAFYTDLDPGDYRFRVIASNNSGVWNEQGATLDFSIAPAYWQTNWFRTLCVAALVALLWTLYRLRVHQIARQFNRTLEARVNERTRIARDLHDTLLQSFHGLLLRFQTARDMFASRPADALKVLDGAIEQAADAITKGRDAVQGLRTSTEETNDLADAIRGLGGALSAEEGTEPGVLLRFDVQGEPRELHPIVRDELVRIAGEAMRNAFRHAEAKQIEVEIHYDYRRLRVRVRDDGKGIAAETFEAGAREGHFGLPGMRERARLIGGKLTVWSGLGAGTEVEVSIPAVHAYVAPPAVATSWRARLARELRLRWQT